MISPSLSNQASTYMLGLSDIPHPCEKDTLGHPFGESNPHIIKIYQIFVYLIVYLITVISQFAKGHRSEVFPHGQICPRSIHILPP